MANVSLADILGMVEKIINLEHEIERAIKNEKDKKRRKKIAKAIKGRDLNALHDLLFNL
jgi:hypothetical protein